MSFSERLLRTLSTPWGVFGAIGLIVGGVVAYRAATALGPDPRPYVEGYVWDASYYPGASRGIDVFDLGIPSRPSRFIIRMNRCTPHDGTGVRLEDSPEFQRRIVARSDGMRIVTLPDVDSATITLGGKEADNANGKYNKGDWVRVYLDLDECYREDVNANYRDLRRSERR